MSLVNVMVNGRAYTIACDDGEEQHLKELAGHVDDKVKELLGSVGQVGEQRLMLMAALLIADEHHEAATRLKAREKELAELSTTRSEMAGRLDESETLAVRALERAADRVESIAARLASA